MSKITPRILFHGVKRCFQKTQTTAFIKYSQILYKISVKHSQSDSWFFRDSNLFRRQVIYLLVLHLKGKKTC